MACANRESKPGGVARATLTVHGGERSVLAANVSISAVGDGIVDISGDDTLYALDAETGTELTANEGGVAIFPSGNVSVTRAGGEGATILALEIVTVADGMATPAV